MRKHLYLITEHDDDEMVGKVLLTEKKKLLPEKNQEYRMEEYNEKTGEFVVVGKHVCMGYHDFESESEADDPDVVSDVFDKKIQEIDQKWLDKAGVELDG